MNTTARRALVTGATSGIGRATALALAQQGWAVALLSRTRERGEAVCTEIRRAGGREPELLLANLDSLAETRAAAQAFLARHDRLDALINNAGSIAAKRIITADGFEQTVAVNHLSHFLLTRLLLEPLRQAQGRVVNVSSGMHVVARLQRQPLQDIFRGQGKYNALRAYADSKAAQVLFTFELAKRLAGTGVTVSALHPGSIATGIWTSSGHWLGGLLHLFQWMRDSPEKAARAVVRLAADPGTAGATGRYYDKLRETKAAPFCYDTALIESCWQVSSQLTGLDGNDT